MKKNCERFVEDIAALASDSPEVSPEAAAHVQHCGSCREKIAAFKAAAAMHREVAHNLAEPKLRLHRRQLEQSLAMGGRARRHFVIRWRPVLVGAVA
jgi:hypothetical protein